MKYWSDNIDSRTIDVIRRNTLRRMDNINGSGLPTAILLDFSEAGRGVSNSLSDQGASVDKYCYVMDHMAVKLHVS